MKTNFVFIFFLILVMVGCMAKPKQPPLTEKESTYFNELSKQCKCFVSRELDPRPEKDKINSQDKGFYLISFDSLTAQQFKNVDSLKSISLPIAKKLHNEILGHSFQYPYDKIIVFYCSRISKTNSKIESFTYKLDELK